MQDILQMVCLFVCFWLTWFCFSFFLTAAKEQYHIPGDYVCLFVFHYILDCPAFTVYSWSESCKHYQQLDKNLHSEQMQSKTHDTWAWSALTFESFFVILS